MFKSIQRFDSKDQNVKKYIFIKKDAIAESVLYKYNSYIHRTVVCCSVMSGCPVGCKFCGTGKHYVRNLTAQEIIFQVRYLIESTNVNSNDMYRLQIMFMSMGEPMLNWNNVKKAIIVLHRLYPNAELLISTVGINNKKVIQDIILLSQKISKIGLQLSIHASTDCKRNKIIPYKNKLCLKDMFNFGFTWCRYTGRKPYINYIIMHNNVEDKDIENLQRLFPSSIFNFTLSVLCSSKQCKTVNQRLDKIDSMVYTFEKNNYDIRQFNPAGQDDIGGGCGQLWFVQEWMKKFLKEK